MAVACDIPENLDSIIFVAWVYSDKNETVEFQYDLDKTVTSWNLNPFTCFQPNVRLNHI